MRLFFIKIVLPLIALCISFVISDSYLKRSQRSYHPYTRNSFKTNPAKSALTNTLQKFKNVVQPNKIAPTRIENKQFISPRRPQIFGHINQNALLKAYLVPAIPAFLGKNIFKILHCFKALSLQD